MRDILFRLTLSIKLFLIGFWTSETKIEKLDLKKLYILTAGYVHQDIHISMQIRINTLSLKFYTKLIIIMTYFYKKICCIPVQDYVLSIDIISWIIYNWSLNFWTNNGKAGLWKILYSGTDEYIRIRNINIYAN